MLQRGVFSFDHALSNHAALKSLPVIRFGDGQIPGLIVRPVGLRMIAVKSLSFRKVKAQEASRRMTGIRQARRSSRSARQLQRRASLTGKGSHWQILNFRQVAAAMAKWA